MGSQHHVFGKSLTVDASSRQARISPWISFRTLRVIILSEGHLRRVLHEYAEYYNTRQPHQGLE